MKPGKGLTRKTGLTARKGLSSSTGLSRTTGLSSRVPAQRATPPPTPAKPRQRPSEGQQRRATDIPQAVRDAVYERDGNTCVRCGCPAPAGSRQIHHRLARGIGSRDGHARMSALITLHGSISTVGCHFEAEQRRPEEYANGWILHSWDDPAEVPVLHALYGWVLLDDDGSVTST